ncbi:MAG TPA: hypothetical protein VFY49_13060 [Myxococcota bacterium]|nr:hypothetical protein [Myxococcota bacterium]
MPDLARRHLLLGWWTLLVFLSLGICLEALQGFKIGFYMDLANATRRHVWTLAHAHGALLGLVNLAFAFTLKLFGDGRESWTSLASAALIGATILLPGGFFLGGVVVYAGDPGLGVLLVPIGGLLLLVAVLVTARGLSAARVRGDGS